MLIYKAKNEALKYNESVLNKKEAMLNLVFEQTLKLVLSLKLWSKIYKFNSPYPQLKSRCIGNCLSRKYEKNYNYYSNFILG